MIRSASSALAMIVWGAAASAQTVKRDLAYGPDPAQRLDLTEPIAKVFATVLFFHGGSLDGGDKGDDDSRRVCDAFAASGIACANVNYRLAPAHRWPAQPQDVAAAVAWMRHRVAARGGDPRYLFLMGHSSGARLVALVGADSQYLARHGLAPRALAGVIAMGSIMWDDELESAIVQYGRARVDSAFRRGEDGRRYDSLASYLAAWPIRYVRSGLPPYLLLIAESEQEHPPVLKTDRAFVERSVARGNQAEYVVLAGRTHYSAIRRLAEPGDPVFKIVRDFVLRRSGADAKAAH